MDLEELSKRASEEYSQLKRRKRELYNLARSLNFSPGESKILSGTSETKIRELASQKHPSP